VYSDQCLRHYKAMLLVFVTLSNAHHVCVCVWLGRVCVLNYALLSLSRVFPSRARCTRRHCHRDEYSIRTNVCAQRSWTHCCLQHFVTLAWSDVLWYAWNNMQDGPHSMSGGQYGIPNVMFMRATKPWSLDCTFRSWSLHCHIILCIMVCLVWQLSVCHSSLKELYERT